MKILDRRNHDISLFRSYLETVLLSSVITQDNICLAHHFFVASLTELWGKLSQRSINVAFHLKVFNIHVRKNWLEDFVLSSFHDLWWVVAELLLLDWEVLLGLEKALCRYILVTQWGYLLWADLSRGIEARIVCTDVLWSFFWTTGNTAVSTLSFDLTWDIQAICCGAKHLLFRLRLTLVRYLMLWSRWQFQDSFTKFIFSDSTSSLLWLWFIWNRSLTLIDWDC